MRGRVKLVAASFLGVGALLYGSRLLPLSPAAAGRGLRAGAEEAAISAGSFTCTGDDVDGRRCVLRDVLFADGKVVVYGKGAVTADGGVPPTLCSVAAVPDSYRSACPVVYGGPSPPPVGPSDKVLDVALGLHRLNPNNAYHTVLEDLVPSLGMLLRDGGLDASGGPAALLRQLGLSRVGVCITDGHGSPRVDEKIWRALLPEVDVVQPGSGRVWVKRLVLGTRSACTHWAHCKPLPDAETGVAPEQPSFDPPDAAVTLRSLTLARLGLEDPDSAMGRGEPGPAPGPGPQPEGAKATATPITMPRVMIVQRKGSREFANVGQVAAAAREVLGGNPRVVEFADMDMDEQVRVAHATDVLIMMHGAALVNMLWLPPGSLLVDVYPHSFRHEQQGHIVHSTRAALAPLGLGHLPFQADKPHLQALRSGPMPEGCECDETTLPGCGAQVFWNLKHLTVDIPRFRRHLHVALTQWRAGPSHYSPPLGRADYFARWDAYWQARTPTQREAPSCWG